MVLGTSATASPPTCFGDKPTIEGTSADETINGTLGDDIILGHGGSDSINGRGGGDFICASDGSDDIDGAGSDRSPVWAEPTSSGGAAVTMECSRAPATTRWGLD